MITSIEHWFTNVWKDTPFHLVFELFLLAFITILLFRKPEPIKDPKDDLTKEEIDQMVSEWKPEPLVPDEIPDEYDKIGLKTEVITSGPSDTIEFNGKKALNFGVPNFFGLNMNEKIIEASENAIKHYAVGACGPRQFYGTMDVHLELEEKIAKWTSSEASVGYCFPFATTASVIQAFCHNTDVCFIDDYSWFAIKIGAELTRGRIIIYKHGDMGDLRDKIIKARHDYSRWDQCNRWVIAEGISSIDGTILDLPSIIKLRHEFFLRVCLDESLSYGVLGKTGRGLMEYYADFVQKDDVEVIIGSLGPAFGSIGGFTVASKELCSFQRIASFAYIFSASPPPYTVVAALKALEILDTEAEARIEKQRSNTKLMRTLLKQVANFDVKGDDIVPIVFLTPKEKLDTRKTIELLQEIVDKCLYHKSDPVFIERTKFVYGRDRNFARQSLRIYVSPAHSENQIEKAANVIVETCNDVMKNIS